MDYSCQGPKDRLDPPKVAAPPLACDCHAHVLGPVDLYPYVADRSFTPPEAETDAYLTMLAAIGMERAVVVQPSVYGADNRRTVAAVAEIGLDRARGVAMVGHDVTKAELKRLDEAGIRGTRFITTARGGPTLDQLPDVARKVAEFGWQIEIYVPVKVWPDILPIVAELPVPIVFDHMGGFPAGSTADDPSLGKVLDLLAASRAWVKLSGYRNSVAGYPYDDVASLARLFIEAAPDRCVWGTDWPHFMISGTMPGDNELLDLLARCAPDPTTREKILVSNPARLYRF